MLKQNDLEKAEKYLDAAWRLCQKAEVADHLGVLYDKQGKHSAAIHLWRLALAANSKDEDAREQLRKAGAPFTQPSPYSKTGVKGFVNTAQELGVLRTIKVPEFSKQEGSAEFFVLLSQGGIEGVRIISGENGFPDGTDAIRAAKFDAGFPDSGPEKILRKGILSCSKYTTPSCNFTMLLPSTVR